MNPCEGTSVDTTPSLQPLSRQGRVNPSPAKGEGKASIVSVFFSLSFQLKKKFWIVKMSDQERLNLNL